MQQEKEQILTLRNLEEAEESYLQQKSRIHWLQAGDQNTSFFHKVVQGRQSRNTIKSIITTTGSILTDNDGIKSEFLSHYVNLLGTAAPSEPNIIQTLRDLISVTLPNDFHGLLTADVTAEEITQIVKIMPKNKSPGPDGFSSEFFSATWDITGGLVISAVKEFFSSGKLLKEFNATLISLIPKCQHPAKVTDYRPISCCNVLYKIISKILANRLKQCLPSLINKAQSAFIEGRQIMDNILLAQEVVRDYHLKSGKPRCALKVDIMKVFDSVNWDFIINLLLALNFPLCYVQWIKECITSPMFSINFNGQPAGFFKGQRGLRQGDPLSPYLFVLCMQIFTELLNRAVQDGKVAYHTRCSRLQLTHLCFADDLMIFSEAKISSLQGILEVLNKFHIISGLQVSCGKSEIFCGGVDEATKISLASSINLKLGSLPIRYLGVHLISGKLSARDCLPLIEKMTSRITAWTSRFLSMAGRLQLVSSVLSTMYTYWCNIFMLPRRIMRKIDSICSAFLWNGNASNARGAKVKWDAVCKPKSEGGLGLKSMVDWNIVCQGKMVWKLFSGTESLWVAWVQANILRGQSFWTVKAHSYHSWCWKKLLKLRDKFCPLLLFAVGDGKRIFVWHDPWHPKGPLLKHFGPGVLYGSGSSINAKLSSMIHNGVWKWPAARSRSHWKYNTPFQI